MGPVSRSAHCGSTEEVESNKNIMGRYATLSILFPDGLRGKRKMKA